MQHLFQSAFLQALGKAIADSIWQMGLLFLVYQVLVFTVRIKQAAAKNLLSSVFALGGFAWFISDIFLHWNKQLKQTASLVIEDAGINNSLLTAFTNDNRWQLFFNWIEYKLHFILPYLSVAYLFVLLWFATKLFVQLHATNSLRNKGVSTVSDELQSFFQFLVQSMGLQKSVQLFISKQIDIPATLGFLKPIVLLPVSAVTHLTPAQLEAVLLHELAHIKRNDYFWNLLLSVAETMLFFNPFALLLMGIARRERENSCDDQVMSFQQNAAVYAEALLTVEKVRVQNPQLAMGLGDNKQHLMLRVKRILNLPAEKNKISTRLLALVFFTLLFALTGWIIRDRKQAVVKEQKTEQNTIAHNTKVVYVKPGALLKKTNQTVFLRDEKRKLRLELKNELNEEKLVVWDEQGGEQLEFDKVIFNDLPAEWMERFVQPYGKEIPSPDLLMAKEQEFIFMMKQDSLRQNQTRYRTAEADFYKKVQNLHEKKLLTRTFPLNQMTVHIKKNWDKDSLFNKMKPFFPEGFVWNEDMHEGAFHFTYPPEEFQRNKEQIAEEINRQQQQRKTKLLYRKNQTRDSSNEKLKERFRTAPAFAYMNDYPTPEEKRMNEERISIIIENNNLYIKEINQQPADSLNKHQPHPPKKIIKRLEIIRL
ncbi:MAG: M48 family metalloprotease [Chitinophagaceae bacterium]|nr:M48 family metalloprotease [Chitinophagaceae bacterium]